MDPLIKAQHTKRRAQGSGSMLLASTPQTDRVSMGAKGVDDTWAVPAVAKGKGTHRSSMDIDATLDWEPDPSDLLPEIEREIGISEWIDPETGAPAEGQSRPHLDME
jgi:hypothetical protein